MISQTIVSIKLVISNTCCSGSNIKRISVLIHQLESPVRLRAAGYGYRVNSTRAKQFRVENTLKCKKNDILRHIFIVLVLNDMQGNFVT